MISFKENGITLKELRILLKKQCEREKNSSVYIEGVKRGKRYKKDMRMNGRKEKHIRIFCGLFRQR